MNHSKLPWEANKFTKIDGSEIMTVDDVIECLSISAKESQGTELFGVTIEGSEDVICYTGNGKTSKENALFIVKACNCHDELLEALKKSRKSLAVAIKSAWEGATDEDVNSHAVIKQIDSAISKAESCT